jgi:hypothetical protein
MAKRSKKAPETVSGSFSAVPHAVLDSAAFQGAGHPARSLLYELIRQLSGRNNGHLQLASPWLKKRRWNSADVVQRAKAELMTRQLAIKTRLGGLNAGPDLWAVTWLPISDYTGLTEVSAMTYHPGAWHFLNLPVPVPKRDGRSVSRSSAVPFPGMTDALTVPSHGAETALFDAQAVPPYGNNVSTNTPLAVTAVAVPARHLARPRRIVGAAGRSGKQAAA